MDTERNSGTDMVIRGIGASLTLSFRRLLRTKLMIANLALAALPVAIVIIIAIASRGEGFNFGENIQKVHNFYEGILRTLFLHFIVFFVANIFGFAVIRQEMDDQTLHYLLLQPIPRWALVVGKLLGYLVLSSVLCVASLWLTYLILVLPSFGVKVVVADLFGDGRFVILVKESLVLVLGLFIYGAIAMIMGSFFKSQAYALLLLGWEAGLPYLPSSLKFWTVSHYLHSLLPVKSIEGARPLFQLLGEPASVGMSLAVLGGVALVLVAVSVVLFQMKQCLYGET